MSDLQFAVFEDALTNRFAVEGEVGRGSRATVYRARDAASGDVVAIKVFNADLASALDFARFARQMDHAAKVRHAGVVPILGVHEAAGRLFSVTPFLEGESLRTRLKRERQVPLAAATAITRQVAAALGAAHAQDVLHKDVKPENIFLSGPTALLMDLGLSRAITRSIDETMTGTGLSLGTPAYMSPEHAMGGVEIDARADLYSLGCVLYEMLAGQPPFTGAEPHKVWMRTLTDTPVPIATVCEGVPADVTNTLDRLLAKSPAARYPDAAHVVDALSEVR